MASKVSRMSIVAVGGLVVEMGLLLRSCGGEKAEVRRFEIAVASQGEGPSRKSLGEVC